MSEDARFEDGAEKPLYLGAMDADDLQVISSLVQDAIFPVTEIRWLAAEQRFAILLNRFRWEDKGHGRHAPERVQSVLAFDTVFAVSSQGIDRKQTDIILSLLSLTYETPDDGSGLLTLTLAGDGAIRLRVETVEATLKDVTRPYRAPSGSIPEHGA